jgi:septum formation protein
VVALYLASTSPARLATLRQVGLSPITVPHTVDEEKLVEGARLQGPLSAEDMVQLLARAKAENAVTADMTGLVVGGDSMFEVGGQVFGKPHTPERAKERWLLQRGHTGVLHSGHWVINVVNGQAVASAGKPTRASVSFRGDISDSDIDRYIATGEPLKVAGAFTIDSLGAAFIDSIEGDPYTVVGLSVSTLRELIEQLGVSYTELWSN